MAEVGVMYGLRKLIATAQQGALDAQIKYSKWSGGLGVVNSGVENFVSAKVAERIHEDLSGTRKLLVGLEYPVQSIIAEIERKVRGRKGGRLNDNGRVDVIVWDADATPRVIIEVKRHFRWQAIESDADRLRQFVKKFGSHLEGGSIAAGLIIIPFIKWTRHGRDDVHPRSSAIQEVKDNAAQFGFKMEKILSKSLEDDDDFRFPDENFDEEEFQGRENLEYCSACFTIEAKDFE